MLSIRLLLVVLLLAVLPLQGWAGGVALESAAPKAPEVLWIEAIEPSQDIDDTQGLSGPADPADADEPQQPGADLADHLLPAPQLRIALPPGRTGPPQYAGAALPDPDLPLLPRPPRG